MRGACSGMLRRYSRKRGRIGSTMRECAAVVIGMRRASTPFSSRRRARSSRAAAGPETTVTSAETLPGARTGSVAQRADIAQTDAFAATAAAFTDAGETQTTGAECVTDFIDHFLFHIPYPRMVEYASAAIFKHDWFGCRKGHDVLERTVRIALCEQGSGCKQREGGACEGCVEGLDLGPGLAGIDGPDDEALLRQAGVGT